MPALAVSPCQLACCSEVAAVTVLLSPWYHLNVRAMVNCGAERWGGACSLLLESGLCISVAGLPAKGWTTQRGGSGRRQMRHPMPYESCGPQASATCRVPCRPWPLPPGPPPPWCRRGSGWRRSAGRPPAAETATPLGTWERLRGSGSTSQWSLQGGGKGVCVWRD